MNSWIKIRPFVSLSKTNLPSFKPVFLMPVFTDAAQTLKECREFADLMVAEPRKCCAFEANILQYNREDD